MANVKGSININSALPSEIAANKSCNMKITKWEKANLCFCKVDLLFRYQGQYEDVETGLYYNRFRWYSPDEGMYISQDPIRLLSGEGNFYAYVKDVNSWVDIFGLSGSHLHHTIPREIYNPRSGKPTKWLPELLAKHPDIKGSRRNPNRWRIPAKEHIALHNKGYNKIWIQEIDKLESIIPDKNKWEVNDILSIRDKLAKEFEIDKYKPKTSCKK